MPPPGIESSLPRPRRAVHAALLLAACLLMAYAAMRSQPEFLSVTVLDSATGEPAPVRVRLTDAGGRPAGLPPEAVSVMYGVNDHADGFGFQPDSSFYAPGSFRLKLPAGTYNIALSRGLEYLDQEHSITIRRGEAADHVFRLERWIDMPARGWYSADGHIHIRRSPREDSLILAWTQAENVHVGVLLRMGDFWATYFSQYAFGRQGVFQRGEYLIASGQEDPRTPELGHALGLGAERFIRNRSRYYFYDETFDGVRTHGGVAGFAHQAATFHGYRGLTIEGLRGNVDILELLQFCAPEGPLFTDHYYHLLDLGIPLTAVAGSDFPWCGLDHRYGLDVSWDRAARIGNARFYTYLGDTLSYDGWREALRAGRTFVTSGPILDLRVEGALPGDRIEAAPGTSLRITAHADGHPDQIPLRSLEIIAHGRVLGRVDADGPGQSARHLVLEMELPVEHGIWIAARAEAGPLQVAHTTPVYVTSSGGGFHHAETAAHYLDLNEQYLQELEQELRQPGDAFDRQAWRHRDGLEARIAETRRVLTDLREQLR